MQPVPGLRERKKHDTRQRIVRVALELFATRGFDGTTVADIAAAADISPRTFFGYFAAKEDVVFHGDAELLAGLAERLRAREPGEDAFDALRAWVRGVEKDRSFEGPDERLRRQLIRATPALEARERTNLAHVEELLAEAVAADLGDDGDSLRPHLVAAAAVAGLTAISRVRDAAANPASTPSSDAVLDEAMTFLQGGLAALRRRD